MKLYFADLHIHIGRTQSGKPVKITGAKSLMLSNILSAAKEPKGLDMIGIIDCHVPEVIQELEGLLEKGELAELEGGGLRYEEEVTLIPGVEMEVYDENCQGPIHLLGFFPDLHAMKAFSIWLEKRVKNISLSTQRLYDTAINVQKKVRELGGLFIPAHVFTPFKSLYGKGVEHSLKEVLLPEMIDAIELGLSSDTSMAEKIEELQPYTFLTNSDAHSLGKIAREYQILKLERPDFASLKKALHSQEGHKVKANYGLNPLLGKYYGTTCAHCGAPKNGESCPECGSRQFIKGVSQRIKELSSEKEDYPERPPYIHQVPLDFLPGLGPKTMKKLLDEFYTEMNILHYASLEQLTAVVKPNLAELIVRSRTGDLQLEAGGGGKYGRISQKNGNQ
ncbi:MAG TPA: endonuclease Q family protein [Chondromyces sp.]|nr:endonuclease Q family protein [Chondromyces sp.]